MTEKKEFGNNVKMFDGYIEQVGHGCYMHEGQNEGAREAGNTGILTK